MGSPSSNIYVGVVDDDQSICRSLSRLLHAVGMQVVTYPSAEAFLKDNKGPRFDCMVLDVRLGGISGLELQQQLLATAAVIGAKPTPIVFITAHDDPQAKEQALQAGCAAYLRKIDPGEMVVSAIRAAIGDTGCTRGS